MGPVGPCIQIDLYLEVILDLVPQLRECSCYYALQLAAESIRIRKELVPLCLVENRSATTAGIGVACREPAH
jgi:hypothetical protein